jgi:hypothetical protein
MSLADLANLSQIVTVLIVVVGLVFAIFQVKEMGRQRRETAAIQLAKVFGSPEFASAFRRVLALPAGAEAGEVQRSGAEDAAMQVSLTIESVGIMVHRRMIDLDMVWELMGGVVLATWDRLRDWSAGHRRATGLDKFDEWFQWLAERFAESYPQARSGPAFKRFAAWRP